MDEIPVPGGPTVIALGLLLVVGTALAMAAVVALFLAPLVFGLYAASRWGSKGVAVLVAVIGLYAGGFAWLEATERAEERARYLSTRSPWAACVDNLYEVYEERYGHRKVGDAVECQHLLSSG